jgi:hypothetical protein
VPYRDKEKARAYNRAYRKADPERARNYKRGYVADPWGRAVKLVGDARRRARQKGLPCTVTAEEIVKRLARGCEVTGVQFDLTRGGRRRPDSPSLDRIDSTEGYTPDNVRVVCWWVNALKSDATLDELRKVAEWVDHLAVTQAGIAALSDVQIS